LSVEEGGDKSCKFLVEVLKMGVLHSPGPVKATYYYIDMELCTMDLEKFIQSPKTFKGESNIWKIMFQIASGVQFIHDRGVVIRDLKPSRGAPPPGLTDSLSALLKDAG
jgi:serine/threonine protein kinase